MIQSVIIILLGGIGGIILLKNIVPNCRYSTLGVLFAVGLSLFGAFFVNSRKAETSLRVVGYSSKLFESDMVKWNLTMQKTTPIAALQTAYTAMSRDVEAFKEYLITSGIKAEDISIQPVTSSPIYEEYGTIRSYSLNQSVFLVSTDLDKVEGLALNPDFFAQRGILIQASNLQYLYTKLPELKKQLLSEATKDAVDRATEISGAAGVKLGKMREARAGVFQITEPYSTDVSDYGIYNTGTKRKSISVTLSSVFTLR